MNTAAETLVELRGIKLRFAGKTILDGVDLKVGAQEVVVIMGLSGGGKSTLLNVLLGLLKASAGSIRFKQDELTRLTKSQLNRIRTRMGMVFQNAALISSMSVRDNIALPLEELSDKNPGEIDSIVDEVIDFVHGDPLSGSAENHAEFVGERVPDMSEAVTENLKRLTGPGSDLAETLKNARTFTDNLNHSQLSQTIANAAQFTDTLKREPWRLIWPSTKEYPDDKKEKEAKKK